MAAVISSSNQPFRGKIIADFSLTTSSKLRMHSYIALDNDAYRDPLGFSRFTTCGFWEKTFQVMA